MSLCKEAASICCHHAPLQRRRCCSPGRLKDAIWIWGSEWCSFYSNRFTKYCIVRLDCWFNKQVSMNSTRIQFIQGSSYHLRSILSRWVRKYSCSYRNAVLRFFQHIELLTNPNVVKIPQLLNNSTFSESHVHDYSVINISIVRYCEQSELWIMYCNRTVIDLLTTY